MASHSPVRSRLPFSRRARRAGSADRPSHRAGARGGRPGARSGDASRAPGTSSRGGGLLARRPRVPAGVAVPAALALVYCLYAAFVSGDNGWSTGLSWLIALVSAAVLFLLCAALGRWQHGRQPETVAVAYAVVGGIALGYLLSLNDGTSVLVSAGVSLLCAAALGACVYYVTHTNRQNRAAARARAARSAEPLEPGRRRAAGSGRAPAAVAGRR